MAKILVACVGNIFLGDDAFGVEVAKRLTQRQPIEGVRVVDFGIRSYDLAYALMENWDLVILVDAVPRGGQPGSLYLIEPELPAHQEQEVRLDAHTMNPLAVLRMVYRLGGAVNRMLVVGCEPWGSDQDTMELSAPVRAAVEQAVDMIEQLITRELSALRTA